MTKRLIIHYRNLPILILLIVNVLSAQDELSIAVHKFGGLLVDSVECSTLTIPVQNELDSFRMTRVIAVENHCLIGNIGTVLALRGIGDFA